MMCSGSGSWRLLEALAVLALLLPSGCGRPEVGVETRDLTGVKTISQIGSTTVLPLAEKWREAFNKEHPEIEIAVSGGGSGTGIKALMGGTADIANASREIKATEVEQADAVGVDPVEHVVAHDGIAVIVHPSNPLAEVSVEQLSNIYAGALTDWSALGISGLREIQVVSRDSASGTYEAFKELVVTLDGSDKSRDYAASALKQGSNQAVLALVARTKTAIGYVGLGYIDDSVKAVSVVPLGGGDPVAPNVENIMSGAYPVSRALYCYTDGEPTGAVKAYLDWVQGPEGQSIVADLGFVPTG